MRPEGTSYSISATGLERISKVFGSSLAYLSSANDNLVEPRIQIHPRKSPLDPAYTIPESQLRGAIHIPSTYTYGLKLPVILCPGTAVPAGVSYRFNYYKLLARSDFADPVFLNIPGTTVHDIQITAQYYAYAINYISATKTNGSSGAIAIVAQSQGAVNAQWALKYWRSTNDAVSSFIALSPAFRGSTAFLSLTDKLWRVMGIPALRQQRADSEFISVLRDQGGSSAYVPTTSIYTRDDELVQPQTGPGASGRLSDVRGVGVTNAEIQDYCPKDTPGGKHVSHVGVLYNAFAYALSVDALMHGDSGRIMRLDLKSICRYERLPGVSWLDVLLTRAGDLVSIFFIAKYSPKSNQEPQIAEYAR